MRTVFIYVNTSKQVGDADHLKVFSNVDAAETWLEQNDSRFWSEPDRPPDHLLHAADRGASNHSNTRRR
jgi:hypothetical protein